jgi:predicted metal-dependent phosphotriesterase family hydrolase
LQGCILKPVRRREFLGSLAAASAAGAEARKVETVTGPIAASQLGNVLMHEHVMVDFIGSDQVAPSRYNADEVFNTALPKLKEAARLGCKTLVECTPAYLGRDAALLQRLSKASGVQILTNTGYYGAANDKYVPKHAYSESPAQIADRWIREVREGIDGTGIKPAFMKIGVDPGPLSAIDAKLIGAAALCHKATGLRLHVHTGDGIAARGINDMLTALAVNPAAYVWVHAQNEKDLMVIAQLAMFGIWIEFDGINPKTLDLHLKAVETLTGQGHLGRLLISQDSGWYRVGEPGGGQFNGYSYLYTDFIPALRKRGFQKDQIQKLLVDNPAQVLTPLT